MTHGSITSATLWDVCRIDTDGLRFDGLGDVAAMHRENLLSFLKDARFSEALSANPNITGVLCSAKTSQSVPPHIRAIVCDDPNWAFFSLLDHLGGTQPHSPNEISSDLVKDNCFLAAHDVVIGKNVVLEPFVTIHSGTRIGDNVTIRSGAALGLDTFQHQRTTNCIISPRHDGLLIIGDGCEIGASAAISKGFSYRATRIERQAKLDAHSYVGHGAFIGEESFICAGAKVMGHAVIGAGAFVGPGAIVSSRIQVGAKARVTLGSVVTRDVAKGAQVSGNFAVAHADFLTALKQKSVQ